MSEYVIGKVGDKYNLVRLDKVRMRPEPKYDTIEEAVAAFYEKTTSLRDRVGIKEVNYNVRSSV